MSKFTGLIDSIYKKIHQKEFLIPGIVIILFLTFKEPLESLASTTIVKYALSKVPSESYIDVIFFIVASYIVFLAIVKTSKRYVASSSITIWMLIISMVYFHYRVIQEPPVWEFTELHYMPFFKYADLVFLGIFFQVLVSITYHLKHNSRSYYKERGDPKKSKYTAFIEDRSLGEDGDDFLGYSDYASELGDKILATNFKEAFAIGVNGKWGSGKTSFIDLLKRRMDGHNLIEVDFNPWNSHTENAVIKDFFETLQDEISPHHSSIARKLVRYSDKLIELNSNTVTQSISAVIRGFTGFDSSEKLHSEVDNALKKIDKKIVVYIDDLDRLDKNEVIEVIRLIRNTANFYNTVFIVAYDRNYIIKALDEFNPYMKERFLEKIFQIEINLPLFNRVHLRKYLIKILSYNLSEEYQDRIKNELFGTNGISPVVDLIDDWFNTVRDITRFTNSFILNIGHLKGEVELSDFIRIEILRLKCPSVYELLHKNTTEFLELVPIDNSTSKNIYQLRRSESEHEYLSYQFEEYLKGKIENKELYLTTEMLEKTKGLLKSIFDRNAYHGSTKYEHLSIIYPSKFKRYFAYSLLSGDLSEVEFSSARDLDESGFKGEIDKWIAKGLRWQVRSRFMEIEEFDNKRDFENVIKSIIYFANRKRKSIDILGREYIGYSESNLLKKLNNSENWLVNKYYSGNEQEFINFLTGLFINATSPYYFESLFLRHINYQENSGFSLSRLKRTNICLKYLEKYSQSIKSVDRNLFRLFHCCKYKKRLNEHGESQEVMPRKAKRLIKKFIFEYDFIGFLKYIIVKHPNRDDHFSVDGLVVEIFDSWDDFSEELLNFDNDPRIKKFKIFYAGFMSQGYEGYVKYDIEKLFS